MPAALQPVMHVMAAAMLDASGRVLLAQRPPGKHLAGMWEFPGGKVEPGEAPLDALVRELREEIGVTLLHAEPLIRVPCHDPAREWLLDTWQTRQWQGEPQSLEGQALQWMLPEQVDPTILARADRVILQALRLPSHYTITAAEVPAEHAHACYARLAKALEQRKEMVQLQLPLWPRAMVRELAASLLPLARRHGSQLLLHGDIDGAQMLGIGVQLGHRELAALRERPLPLSQLVGASCDGAADLERAERLGVDFATLALSNVAAEHRQNPPMDWAAFATLAEAAALPVYADAGLASAHLAEARQNHAQGIVNILS